MKLTKKTILMLALSFITFSAYTQHCDSLMSICRDYLSKPSKKDPRLFFISDGQTYRALLNEGETAEFTTTFFGGSTYRLAATAGLKDRFIIFDIYDSENNLLFSNMDYNNEPWWDFRVENTLDVRIEVRLDATKKQSGCTVLLIGFKQLKKK